MSGWNARADASTYIILWFGTILAVLIISTWYFTTIYPLSEEFDVINEFLDEMQEEFNKACNSVYYVKDINPELEKGIFYTNNTHICLNTIRTNITDCRIVFCNINENMNFSFDLQQISYITLERNNSLFNLTSG